MLEKFKFIFKDFKKANKYAQYYDKNFKNYNLKPKISEKTYIWVEKGSDILY